VAEASRHPVFKLITLRGETIEGPLQRSRKPSSSAAGSAVGGQVLDPWSAHAWILRSWVSWMTTLLTSLRASGRSWTA
jgi:hypothetical protein